MASRYRSSVVALIPIRDPGEGKTRLADRLSRRERAALAAAMLADVAAAVRTGPVDRVVVAASGPTGAAAAGALGLDVLLDPPSAASLDDVLDAATGRLLGTATLVVIAADLPQLRPDDVAELVAVDAQVAVAPTADGGTGALLRRPPAVIGTAFGPGSAAAHLHLGHRAGVETRTVSLPGFRHDVDTWEDLVALGDDVVGRATAALLARLRTAG